MPRRKFSRDFRVEAVRLVHERDVCCCEGCPRRRADVRCRGAASSGAAPIVSDVGSIAATHKGSHPAAAMSGVGVRQSSPSPLRSTWWREGPSVRSSSSSVIWRPPSVLSPTAGSKSRAKLAIVALLPGRRAWRSCGVSPILRPSIPTNGRTIKTWDKTKMESCECSLAGCVATIHERSLATCQQSHMPATSIYNSKSSSASQKS